MSRRKPPEPISTTPDRDYWLKYLRYEGLISDVEMEAPVQIERAAPVEAPPTPKELTEEQKTFIKRVAEKLVGDPVWQKYYERGLTNVFLGLMDFNDWFEHTRVERGLHAYNFLQILRDSLDGLTSPECKLLRKQYNDAMQKVTRLA